MTKPSEARKRLARLANRYLLDDGTLWPDLSSTEQAQAAAYRTLLNHPWGTNVSCAKIRMLRREARHG